MRNRYEDVAFTQMSDDYAEFERVLEEGGEDAALEYAKQWHHPGSHDCRPNPGYDTSDEVYEKDGYILSWNSSIGYWGLVYDRKFRG